MPIDGTKLTMLPKQIKQLPDVIVGNPQWLKEYFDADSEALQEKHNALIDFLKQSAVGDSAAAAIGSEPIPSVAGSTVRDQIADIKTQLNNVVLDQVPDGSISAAKIADSAVTQSKIANGAVTEEKLSNISEIVQNIMKTGWLSCPTSLTYASTDGPIQIANTGADVSKIIGLGNRIKLDQQQALTAYWNMDSDANSQVGSFNGTETNVTHTAGKFENAATFNGSSSKIVIPDNASLKPTGPFTVGLWFKESNTVSAIQTIIQSYSELSIPAGFAVYVEADGRISAIIGNGTTYTVISNKVLASDKAWHYIVLSYRDNYMQLYVDGQFVGGGYVVAPVYAGNSYTRIGCGNRTGNDERFVNGQIDDVFFINGYALGEDAVKKQYGAQTAQGTGSITVTKYFLVHGVTSGALTLYGGTDYALTSGAISNICYSQMKAPFGFPIDPYKWSVLVTLNSALIKNSPTSDVWYGGANIWTAGSNLMIIIPIGTWHLSYEANVSSAHNSTAIIHNAYITLSTSTDSESHAGLFTGSSGFVGYFTNFSQFVRREHTVIMTTKTTWYLLAKIKTNGTAPVELRIPSEFTPITIEATDAYL